MNLFFNIFLLCVGLVCLWKSGDLAVRNAIGVSVIYGIERFTIGYFIFGISTVLPEISSAVVSSVKKVPELSAGDLMGSSLVNMTLILGIALLLAKKIEVSQPLKKKIYQTVALIGLIFLGIAFFPRENILKGILLIVAYIGSIFWFQAGVSKKAIAKEIVEMEEKIEEAEKKIKISPKLDIILKFFVSLVFLVLSSWVTVHAAVQVASLLQINLTVIGAVFIAIGTSFPELSLGINAIKHKEYDLALGDIFGSSLLNVSLILGILTLLNPTLNLLFVRQILPFIFAAMLWLLQKLLRNKHLQKIDACIFLSIFILYIGWIFFSPMVKFK